MSGRGPERPQDRRKRPGRPEGPADDAVSPPERLSQPSGPSERRQCADCRLVTRLDPDPSQWSAWHRWRVRALVEVLVAARRIPTEAQIETDRDRLVILAGYCRQHCGEARSAA